MHEDSKNTETQEPGPAVSRDLSPRPSEQTLYPSTFFGAVTNGNEAEVRSLLVARYEDPNETDKNGRTPLSYAAENGYESIVKLLLDEGRANPRISTETGHSPLSYAAANGHEAVVKLLLLGLSPSATKEDLRECSKRGLLQLIQSAWVHLGSEIERGNLLELLAFTGFRFKYAASEIPSTWSGYIRCQWEIPHVLDEMKACRGSIRPWEGLEGGISNFVVLTGSGGVFECSSCKEFLWKTWGEEVGSATLDMIHEALRLDSPVLSHSHTLQRFPITPFKFSKTQVTFYLNTTDYDKSLFVEAPVWLCSAVRLNPYTSKLPTTLRRELYPSKTWLETKITGQRPFQLLGFCLEPLHELPLESFHPGSQCWTQLFQTGIVACHTLERRWGRGVEMSFDTMVHLAAVENYYPFRDGKILLGFSTALVPVSRDSESGGMQWHFETTDEPEQTRLNLEKLSCVHQTWFQTRDVNILRQSKCFVGWFERANILLGSSSLVDRTPVTWSSGLNEQTRTAHLRGFTVGCQLTISAGPIQLSPNFTNSFAFHSNIQCFNRS